MPMAVRESKDAVGKHGPAGLGLPVCTVLGFKEMLEGFSVPMLMLMSMLMLMLMLTLMLMLMCSLFPQGPAAASVSSGHREALCSRQG